MNAIFEEAIAPYTVRPIVVNIPTKRPSDDDLLLALVFYFGASEETTLDWIEGMDIETMRDLMAQPA